MPKLKAPKPHTLHVPSNEENLLNLFWRIGLYVTQNINPSPWHDLGCLECKYLDLEQEVARPLWQPSPCGSVESAYGSNMKTLLSKLSKRQPVSAASWPISRETSAQGYKLSNWWNNSWNEFHENVSLLESRLKLITNNISYNNV